MNICLRDSVIRNIVRGLLIVRGLVFVGALAEGLDLCGPGRPVVSVRYMPIPVLESQKVLNPPGARFRLTINYHWPLFVAVCQHMQVVFELGVLRREGGGCLEVESVCARGVSLLERCEWTHVHHNRTHPFDGGWRVGRFSGGGGGRLRGGGRFRGGGRLRGGGSGGWWWWWLA